jgi:predicted transcriptional regulator
MAKMTSFLKAMDSTEIEARFSNDCAIKYEDITDSNVSYEEIKPFIDRLPPREVDLIELYYCEHKNQKDIAKIFGVTQGAVSSRLARAKKRLQFLRDLPKISEMEIDKELGKYFDRIELEIIKCMVQTTCQSKTADLINKKFNLHNEKDRMTQVKVRHRFERCRIYLDNHKSKKPELAKYSNLMEYIKKNLYKLHEVILPHFDRGKCCVFSLTV